MAKPYPILPLSVLDDLGSLNSSFMAYQYAVEAILRRIAQDGAPYDIGTLVAGLDNMSGPILDGYKSIHDQVQQFREMGFVGVGQLSEPDQQ